MPFQSGDSFRRSFNQLHAAKAAMGGETLHPFWCVYTISVEDAQANLNAHPTGPALRFVAAALIVRGGEVLICQRRPDQPMALQWEFPGGKIEAGESPEQALARELDEELGIQATIGPRVTHIRQQLPPWGRRGPAVLRRPRICRRAGKPDFSSSSGGRSWKTCPATTFWPPTGR